MLHYLRFLILALGIVSCQSIRFTVPPTEAYHGPARVQQVVSASPAPPVLLAALPDSAGWNAMQGPSATPPSGAGKAILPVQQPDTTLKQAEPPVLSGKADPTTTVVNVIGGAAAAVGLGVIIANSGEAPQTEWGGLGQAIGLLAGVVLALSGLVLLFFQGKNGRLRRLREARKAVVGAASSPTPSQRPAVAPEPVESSATTSRKQKLGFRLMIAGGVLGLLGFLGFLVGGFFLLLLPVAVVLLLIGAIVSITGH